jgi:uncharacterized protein YndB with AHSA1/START domain
MFTDPARLVRWIGISASLEPRPVAPSALRSSQVSPARVSSPRSDPPRRLVFTWGWTEPGFNLPPGTSRVRVDLEATPSGTNLRLVHDRFPRHLRVLHDDGWTNFLGRLWAVLLGAPPGDYPAGKPQKRAIELAEGQAR